MTTSPKLSLPNVHLSAPLTVLVPHRARVITQLLTYVATWKRYDRDHLPEGLPEKFISGRQAAELIPNGATVISTGMAAHHRCSTLYWSIRDRFLETGAPNNLTWCGVGGIGGRGKLPGTLEELGLKGLVTKAVLGHVETIKTFLELADAGDLELHTLPIGEYTFLLEAQGEGRTDHSSAVGVGSFLDPRVGTGSYVSGPKTEEFITVDGDLLNFRAPKIEFATIAVPWADIEGNLYGAGAACLTEVHDAAKAAHANGGTVIASVAGIVDHNPAEILIPAEWVDAIVIDTKAEQSGGIKMTHAWDGFSTRGTAHPELVLADTKMVNQIIGVTPRRSAADMALARLGASVAATRLKPGSLINTGVGLPEVVGALLGEAGLNDVIDQTTEAGVLGGTPAAGIYFGASVNPRAVLRSADIFHMYEAGLDLTCLGFLELDHTGNINSSRRGPGAVNAVGPGGLPNIAHHASTVLYVGRFAMGEKIEMTPEGMHVVKQGTCRFVDTVKEVSFNGQLALERGQQVFVATHRGLLQLTAAGFELVSVMPGIDIDRDILDHACGAVSLPAGGKSSVATICDSILTGDDYSVQLGDIATAAKVGLRS